MARGVHSPWASWRLLRCGHALQSHGCTQWLVVCGYVRVAMSVVGLLALLLAGSSLTCRRGLEARQTATPREELTLLLLRLWRLQPQMEQQR